MVFGGSADGLSTNKLLQLNHDTLWSGRPRNGNSLDAKSYLADVRRAVLEDHNYHLADEICHKMQGAFMEGYQPLGNLRMAFVHTDRPAGYRRDLNLDTACASVQYAVGDVHYLRESFVSAPDNVIVLRASASRPGMLNCTVSLDGDL